MSPGVRWLGAGLLIGWGLVSLAPLAWMALASLAPADWLVSDRPLAALAPTALGLDSYRTLLARGELVGWTLNSLLVAGSVALGQVLAASGLAYVLAKRRFPGRQALLIGLAVLLMVPGQVVMVPLFRMVARLGLLDTLWAVILPALASPFGVLLMYDRMRAIPDELLDAARVDGCSETGIFLQVALPLARAQAGTLAVFSFMGQWNAFMWPLMTLLGSDRYTLPVGLATLQGQNEVEYGLLLAGASLAALPAVLLALAGFTALSQGSYAAGVKG